MVIFAAWGNIHYQSLPQLAIPTLCDCWLDSLCLSSKLLSQTMLLPLFATMAFPCPVFTDYDARFAALRKTCSDLRSQPLLVALRLAARPDQCHQLPALH